MDNESQFAKITIETVEMKNNQINETMTVIDADNESETKLQACEESHSLYGRNVIKLQRVEEDSPKTQKELADLKNQEEALAMKKANLIVAILYKSIRYLKLYFS